MFEYIRRKLLPKKFGAVDIADYPRYYKEKGRLVKELANGEKWIIRLDENHREILIVKLK